MNHKIAVFDYRLPLEVQNEIQALSASPVNFPDNLTPHADAVAHTGDADIVLVSPWDKIDAAYLNACPQIKYVGLCGTSTAHIDTGELERRGIAFSNVVSPSKEHVAEFFFIQLAMLARGVGEYRWKDGPRELQGKTLGIIGLGAVGGAMAQLGLAYKMDVGYFSPHRKPGWEDKGLKYHDKRGLLETSDIAAVCSPTNVMVMGAGEFESMKPGSIFVQASGGTSFDAGALRDWVSHVGNFAIFDMSAGKDNYDALHDLPHVIFPNAVAGDTVEANARRGQRILVNLKDYLANH